MKRKTVMAITTRNVCFFFLMMILFFSCSTDPTISEITFNEIPFPCKEGGTSDMFAGENGNLLASWVEYANDSTDVLMYSEWNGNAWEEPREIAGGSDWFVNWADFPTICKSGENIAAHWLQKSAGGTYDYDVKIAVNSDGKWNAPFIPHKDGVAAEHGFVSMLPLKNGRFFATWLDGRNTKNEGHGHSEDDHGHGHGGAMTLRAAEFDPLGKMTREVELDHKVCDCCQTDAAKTDDGIVVVYRDRSDEEIRDISITRFDGKDWTLPKNISKDNWKIAGCPVNGPSVISLPENKLAVAWFSSPENSARVNIAFSENGGKDFSTPIRVDDGSPIGRVDIVALDGKNVMVSWMEKKLDEKAEVRVKIIPINGMPSDSFSLTEINPSRKSGFPILIKNDTRFFMSWTHVQENGKTRIRFGELVLN